MSYADYNEFIQRELVPEMVDTVIYQKLQPWLRIFGTTPPDGGDRITSKYRLAYTSNAAFYDKSDVDPAVSTQTLKKPYWTKVFSHGACEVHGIDISNARPSPQNFDMVRDAIAKETEAVIDVNITGFYAQILKDIDSSGTAYSDASLSRSTYPLLVSYEEETDTAITLAYMRGLIKGCTQDKQTSLRDYIVLMESAVYYVLQPLAAALHTWTVNDPAARQGIGMGYRPMVNFEGVDIADPEDFPGMTTGSVFMVRKQDVNIVPHRPLTVSAVPSGRDSLKFVVRTGYNIYVDNPYLNGKLLNKD